MLENLRDGQNWEDDELTDLVKEYIKVRGATALSDEYFVGLNACFKRKPTTLKRQMRNISRIYANLNLEWVPALPPLGDAAHSTMRKIKEIVKYESEITEVERYRAEFDEEVDTLQQQEFSTPPTGTKNPEKQKGQTSFYKRDTKVAAWVYQQSNGICECCGKDAPFTKDNGKFFLEVHHLKRLADGGSDTPENAVAVCPNCHRELHSGENRETLLAGIYKKYEETDRLIKE